MKKNLMIQAIAKFSLGVILVAVFLFGGAGTVLYPRGWLLMGLLFLPMFLAGLVLMAKNPDLLRKRLHGREEQGEQRLVIRLSGLIFLLGFVLAG